PRGTSLPRPGHDVTSCTRPANRTDPEHAMTLGGEPTVRAVDAHAPKNDAVSRVEHPGACSVPQWQNEVLEDLLAGKERNGQRRGRIESTRIKLPDFFGNNRNNSP
ncbi:hypothetical protein, partial [Streptomyces mirabilis]